MNPNEKFRLPLYALPDLVSMGPSWLFAITKTPHQQSVTIYEAANGAGPPPNGNLNRPDSHQGQDANEGKRVYANL